MEVKFDLEFAKVQTDTLRELVFWLDGYCPVQQCGCAREDLLAREHVEALSEIVRLMSNAIADENIKKLREGGAKNE